MDLLCTPNSLGDSSLKHFTFTTRHVEKMHSKVFVIIDWLITKSVSYNSVIKEFIFKNNCILDSKEPYQPFCWSWQLMNRPCVINCTRGFSLS